MYCSPAFLQFMKEGNVVLAFVLSCIAGLQVCTRARFVNIVWILAGASMAVSGQAHFAMTGFVFQLVSQFGECGKNVMGDWMMKSHLKLDALTYTMFLSPMHGRTTSCRSGDGNEFWRRFESCWQRMASRSLQVCAACLLRNVRLLMLQSPMRMSMLPSLRPSSLTSILMKVSRRRSSSFILAGLVMNAVVVICGVGLLREAFVTQQRMSFLVCLSGVDVCMLLESKFENRLHGSCVSTALIVLVFVVF